MAFRIGQFVVAGELNNTRRNSIHGWLAFGEDEGLRLDLAGYLQGELAGKRLRFEVAAPLIFDDTPRENLEALQVMQIGVAGVMQFRMVRVPTMPIEEFYKLAKSGERPPTDEKPSLYLEWYSQNGRVLAEIVDPTIDYNPVDGPLAVELTPELLPEEDGSGPGITGYIQNEDGAYEELSYDEHEDDEEDDPYQLFPADLESQLSESYLSAEAPLPPEFTSEPRSGPRNWDEVPGIDEETKEMYKQWDEVVYGTKDEPLATLFDPPISLKRPNELADEEEAEAMLTMLLARLALCCVAIDICPHFSPSQTYRWLLEEILPNANVHPQLPTTGFVQHYSTWESCPKCEAEFDAESAREYGDDDEDQDNDDDVE